MIRSVRKHQRLRLTLLRSPESDLNQGNVFITAIFEEVMTKTAGVAALLANAISTKATCLPAVIFEDVHMLNKRIINDDKSPDPDFHEAFYSDFHNIQYPGSRNGRRVRTET